MARGRCSCSHSYASSASTEIISRGRMAIYARSRFPRPPGTYLRRLSTPNTYLTQPTTCGLINRRLLHDVQELVLVDRPVLISIKLVDHVVMVGGRLRYSSRLPRKTEKCVDCKCVRASMYCILRLRARRFRSLPSRATNNNNDDDDDQTQAIACRGGRAFARSTRGHLSPSGRTLGSHFSCQLVSHAETMLQFYT